MKTLFIPVSDNGAGTLVDKANNVYHPAFICDSEVSLFISQSTFVLFEVSQYNEYDNVIELRAFAL